MRSPESSARRRSRRAGWSAMLGIAPLSFASPASAATSTAVPSPNLTQFHNVLWGTDALSPSSAWAVGRADTGTLPINRPVIERWNGTSWSVVPTPTANDATLEGVVALASNDVWAVGSMFSTALLWHVPFALHWDGRNWSSVAVPSPTPQGGRLFGVAALSPTKVYGVGQAPNIPSLVMRWNGASWSRETTPSTGTVWDAAAVGPGTVWAVGQRGNPNIGVGRTFIMRTTNG